MAKISGQYFSIHYYFGEYRVGQSKVYHTVIWADNEEAARAEFHTEVKGANIKWID